MTDHGEIRYCPRCDTETVWSNIADGGYVFACTLKLMRDGGVGWGDPVREWTEQGCGLKTAEPVTDVEHARLMAWDSRNSRPRVVRRYENV